MSHQLNILIILTDQQAYSAMSCAGNAELQTPAMDSLAETGVLFSKTYCTYPLCTPSRASMFTGHMPHVVGINENDQPIDERFRDEEMGFLFQRAGYDCVYGGKWHIPEIAMPDGEHGFRTICGCGPAMTAFTAASGTSPRSPCPTESMASAPSAALTTSICPSAASSTSISPTTSRS